MDDPEKHKTFISSIVFSDIVGFSIEPVSDQLTLKSTLNQLVSTVLSEVPSDEAIVLDSGDGSAICFLGDPEVALNCAVWMQGTILDLNPTLAHPLQVRFGINLGPVKVLKDFNQHQNVVGDGINVAQRIMSFADPNQILVSRSFYEVISCLTKEHSLLFDFKGVRKDKHVREHSVYEVRIAGSERPPAAPIPDPAKSTKQLTAEDVITKETLLALESVGCSYLGPMAKVLVRNAVQTRAGLTELLETISNQLTNEVEKKKFLKESLCLLQSSNGSCFLPLGSDAKTAPTAPGSNTRISLSEMELLTRALGVFLGPIANTLVKQQVKNCSSINQLCEALSAEIEDPEDRDSFVRQIKSMRDRSSATR